MSGMQNGLHVNRHGEDDGSVELQPRSSIPLYFDSTSLGIDSLRTFTSDDEDTVATPPMNG